MRRAWWKENKSPTRSEGVFSATKSHRKLENSVAWRTQHNLLLRQTASSRPLCRIWLVNIWARLVRCRRRRAQQPQPSWGISGLPSNINLSWTLLQAEYILCHRFQIFVFSMGVFFFGGVFTAMVRSASQLNYHPTIVPSTVTQKFASRPRFSTHW